MSIIVNQTHRIRWVLSQYKKTGEGQRYIYQSLSHVILVPVDGTHILGCDRHHSLGLPQPRTSLRLHGIGVFCNPDTLSDRAATITV